MPFLALSVVLSLICAASLSAQTRLSDKDVLQHMKNLKDDAKKFRSSLNSAGEGREDAGAEFREADKFHVRSVREERQGRTVPAELPRHCATDRQNHDQHPDGPAANTQWSTVKTTELNTLAQAFHVSGL